MPYLFLSIAACFWGGNYVIGHILVTQADPVILSEARWTLTAFLLVCLYFKQIRQQWPSIRAASGRVFFLAVCGQVLFPVTLYIGLQYTTSLNAAIYLSTTPALVLILNKVVFKERISLRNILGVILSTIGVVWLVMQGDVFNISKFSNLNQGDLWTMGSAVSWALYCSFLRTKPREVGGSAFVAISAALGAILLLPVVIVRSMLMPLPDFHVYLNSGFLAGLIYLIVFPSWLSYLFWNKGIQVIGASRGEIYSHLIPLSGGIFSIIFLDVQLHIFHLVSAIIITIGIILCSFSRQNSVVPGAIKARD